MPFGTVFDDFGPLFPAMLTDLKFIFYVSFSMMLDDFLANLFHAQELNFIDLSLIWDGCFMILDDFVTIFLMCLHTAYFC